MTGQYLIATQREIIIAEKIGLLCFNNKAKKLKEKIKISMFPENINVKTGVDNSNTTIKIEIFFHFCDEIRIEAIKITKQNNITDNVRYKKSANLILKNDNK